ncbi:MAG: hypothetical protein K2O66_07810 [Bacteroidales bacterium]|nr:hypothetical protein [Bacteroidales bacterium]
MKRKTLCIILTFLLPLFPLQIRAQNGVGLYFTDILPQRNLSNPSFYEPYALSIGFPGASGIHAHLDNNFFSWNALVTRGADASLRM